MRTDRTVGAAVLLQLLFAAVVLIKSSTAEAVLGLQRAAWRRVKAPMKVW